MRRSSDTVKIPKPEKREKRGELRTTRDTLGYSVEEAADIIGILSSIYRILEAGKLNDKNAQLNASIRLLGHRDRV